ncbi:MAG: flagellar biosynthetic protein FliP [Isosphaera sp.]|nr:flagellar biosynthetic protein FliP [Isosphaera sp.]
MGPGARAVGVAAWAQRGRDGGGCGVSRRWAVVVAVLAAWAALAWPGAALAQGIGPGLSDGAGASSGAAGFLSGGLPGGVEGINPISVLGEAARLLPATGARDGARQGPGDGDGQGGSSQLSAGLSIVLLLTVLSLAPSVLLTGTCFLRIVVVLGLLKQALGTQQMPPSQTLLGLALVMTMLVMTPTLRRVETEAIGPYQRGEVRGYDDLWDRSSRPVRDFMFDQIEASGNWSSLYAVLDFRGVDVSDPSRLTRASVDTPTLLMAFVMSELKVAFLIGFRVYLPFLVIDMVISSLLISMSMISLPPVLISLPFKLLMFVLVDGWTLVCVGLMRSFAVGGGEEAAAAVSAATIGGVSAAVGGGPLAAAVECARAWAPWA